MKRQFQLTLFVSILALLAGGLMAHAQKVTEPLDVHQFAPHPCTDEFFPPSDASAIQIRGKNSVAVSIHTDNLPEGAYTLWGIIFNHPDACDGPCGADDLGRDGVDSSVARAGGSMINNGDNAHIAGTLQVGDTSEALNGPGLLDTHEAEIHYVIRYHGPAIPGIIDEMLHSFNGGCDQITCGADGVMCFDPQAVGP